MRGALFVTVFSALVSGCAALGPESADIRPLERIVDNAAAIEARALAANARNGGGIAVLEATLAQSPDNREARFDLAETLRRTGKAGEAIAHYRKLAEDDAWRVRALEGLGQCELVLGQHDAAYRAFAEAVSLDQGSWRSWLGLAQLRDIARDWKKADEAYGAAQEAAGAIPVILNNRGVSNLARGNHAEASRWFAKAIEADTSFTRAQTNLALANASQARALTRIESEADEKSRARMFNNYGYVAMIQGRFDEAQLAFRAALETHPAFYAIAYKNLNALSVLKERDASP